MSCAKLYFWGRAQNPRPTKTPTAGQSALKKQLCYLKRSILICESISLYTHIMFAWSIKIIDMIVKCAIKKLNCYTKVTSKKIIKQVLAHDLW